ILLGILFVTNSESARERRTSEVNGAVTTGQAVAGIVDGFAHDLEVATFSLASAMAAQQQPIDQLRDGPQLRAVSDQYGMLRGLFITDLSGRVVASASGEGIGLDLSTRPYLQALRSGQPTFWGPGIPGIESGDITVTYGRAIAGADGPRAYLVAAFYPPKLAD